MAFPIKDTPMLNEEDTIKFLNKVYMDESTKLSDVDLIKIKESYDFFNSIKTF